MKACQHGHFEVVKYLIDQNANIRTRDKKDFTPLHCSALANDINIVKLLVKLKIDINALDVQKMTPIKLVFLYLT